MYPTITLRKGKDQSLRRYHPWVYSGAIARTDDGIEEGDIVRIVTAEGELLGVGHYQIGSIAVRMLSFSDTVIDDDYWKRRLGQAIAMRRAIGVEREDNNMYRLVHGEGDWLPGLVIDIYGNSAVMQAHSVGMHRQRKEIAHALQELMPSQTVFTNPPNPAPTQGRARG